MRASWPKIWIAAALLVTSAAQGQTLYQRDGIALQGSVRMVAGGASICHVLPEHHPAELYEGIRANHGQPLHVWRLDFAARNGSDRRLEHLTTIVRIESERPPCTTWIGLGDRYAEDAVWSDIFRVLRMPLGMEPGEEVVNTVFVLAFHGRQPKFESWQLAYRFALETALGPATVAPRDGSPASEGGPGLPPQILADRYLLHAEYAARHGDSVGARWAMKQVQALRAEHGLELAPEEHFRYAQAWEAAAEPEQAKESAERYVQLQGQAAERYAEALELIDRTESGQLLRPGLVCAEVVDGTHCWKELDSHPGCHVWDVHRSADRLVEWTGRCSDGIAIGKGTLRRVGRIEKSEHTGLLRNGKRHGPWVVRTANGTVSEGLYVGGMAFGDWVIRTASGTLAEGPFVDNKRHGRWVVRYKMGTVQEGTYVEGEQHGDWVERYPNGSTRTFTYVNGVQR